MNDEVVMGPLSISERWPALPAVIDTAFEDLLTKKLYFFSGKEASYSADVQDSSIQNHTRRRASYKLFLSLQGPDSGCTQARILWVPVA